MRYVMLLIAATLAGCATQVNKAAPQLYRAQGAETPIEINGALLVKPGVINTARGVAIYFNGSKQIEVGIDRYGNGENGGEPFNGKATSATCTGRPISSSRTEVRCMVFVGNERTVTLTF